MHFIRWTSGSVGFCRGSRVEGNMSRVEVEGKKKCFFVWSISIRSRFSHILGFHLTSRLDFRRTLVSGLPSLRRMLHGCAMQVALGQRIIELERLAFYIKISFTRRENHSQLLCTYQLKSRPPRHSGPGWGFDLTSLQILTNPYPTGAYWLEKPPPLWGNHSCSLTDY